MKKFALILSIMMMALLLSACNLNKSEDEAPEDTTEVVETEEEDMEEEEAETEVVEESSEIDEPVPAPSEEASSFDENTDYIGLSVELAQELAASRGAPFRVTKEDGVDLAVTLDYRPGRINATVESGVVVDYNVEGGEDGSGEMTYDENSWRTEIAESCTSYYDGCNTCKRIEGSDAAACTKKFCENYEKPYCLDKQK